MPIAYQSTLGRVITNQIELGAKLTSLTPMALGLDGGEEDAT